MSAQKKSRFTNLLGANDLGMVRNNLRFGAKQPKKWCLMTGSKMNMGRKDLQPFYETV